MARRDSVRIGNLLATIASWGAWACGPELSAASSDETSDSSADSDPTELEDPPHACAPAPVPDDPLADGSCEAYARVPAASGLSMTVRISNHSPHPLLVPDQVFGCHHQPRYFGAAGRAFGRELTAVRSNCFYDGIHPAPCGRRASPCLLCLTIGPPLLLHPGGTMAWDWEPLFVSAVPLPESCRSEADAEMCSVFVGELDHEIRFSTVASPCPSCQCPDGENACFVSPWGMEKPDVSVAAHFDLQPGCSEVELVFE